MWMRTRYINIVFDSINRRVAGLLGIGDTDRDFGTFPLDILSDNADAKALFTEAEAAIDDNKKKVDWIGAAAHTAPAVSATFYVSGNDLGTPGTAESGTYGPIAAPDLYKLMLKDTPNATGLNIADAGNHFPTDNVEAALQHLAVLAADWIGKAEIT
ncbi:hypothetical protein [uncultured Pelagimonas sp.]|uniref:hypothetical protein n=1 Tax=uncultured Pelagimonas sp. TaxID=1618102 RepID=UPI0026113369|nr:hypothetical protein [uncultured Pelagimonas sp.]